MSSGVGIDYAATVVIGGKLGVELDSSGVSVDRLFILLRAQRVAPQGNTTGSSGQVIHDGNLKIANPQQAYLL